MTDKRSEEALAVETRAKTKDRWDKTDTIARVIAATATPVIVALSVYAWNTERSAQESAARNLQIALEVLRTPPLPDGSDTKVRSWAVRVLQSPDEPLTFPAVDDFFLGQVVDSVVCEATIQYRRALAGALIEDGGPNSLSAGRNIIAVLDAGCGDWEQRPSLGE